MELEGNSTQEDTLQCYNKEPRQHRKVQEEHRPAEAAYQIIDCIASIFNVIRHPEKKKGQAEVNCNCSARYRQKEHVVVHHRPERHMTERRILAGHELYSSNVKENNGPREIEYKAAVGNRYIKVQEFHQPARTPPEKTTGNVTQP